MSTLAGNRVLELEDITRRFGSGGTSVLAVAGVSLAVARGETLGIVGESGSGKSTVARIAAGLDRPTAGAVRRADSADGTSAVQMVFQDPASSLDPLMRVGRSVREPLDAATGRNRREVRIDDLLASVGLGGDAGGRLPAMLSGGQKQRASIARALAALPPLVICDEAVTALDVSIRAQVLNLLRELQARNNTSFLFISHDLCTVAYMSHRVAVMYLGKVVETGPTAELLAAAAHPYTMALLSAVPRLQQGIYRRAHIRLRGDPPSSMHPPSGCRFHTRCPLATDLCRAQEPVLKPVGEGHLAACHYAPVDAASLVAASGRPGAAA